MLFPLLFFSFLLSLMMFLLLRLFACNQVITRCCCCCFSCWFISLFCFWLNLVTVQSRMVRDISTIRDISLHQVRGWLLASSAAGQGGDNHSFSTTKNSKIFVKSRFLHKQSNFDKSRFLRRTIVKVWFQPITSKSSAGGNLILRGIFSHHHHHCCLCHRHCLHYSF